MWLKIIMNLVTLGIPAIIQAASRARRKKREQEARLKRARAREQWYADQKAAKK